MQKIISGSYLIYQIVLIYSPSLYKAEIRLNYLNNLTFKDRRFCLNHLIFKDGRFDAPNLD
jgi:hypothetical protein